MSKHSIQPYEPLPLGEPVVGMESTASETSGGVDAAWLIGALRRHWKLVVLVWLLAGALGAAYTYRRIGPTYTASAQIELKPAVASILDGENRIVPFYDSHLATQARLLASQPVLLDALQDPKLQDLELVRSEEPLAALRNSLEVDNPRGTHLLLLRVTHAERGAAIRLAQAVLDAYMARADGLDAEMLRRRRDALEAQRQALRTELEQQAADIARLAEPYGTSSYDTFATLRKGVEDLSLATRKELEQTKRDIIVLEQQIRQLDQSVLTEDLRTLREQLIEDDPGVQWVKKDIAQAREKLARLRSSNQPAAQAAIPDIEKQLAQLDSELVTQRERAAAGADREIQRKHQQRLEERRIDLETKLTALQYQRDMLQRIVDEKTVEGQDIGRQEALIKALNDRRDRTQKDYEQVMEALRRLDVERQSPARINIASQPEILPDGIVDKRKKFLAMALAGSLMLALMAGLARAWFDPHLRSSQEVAVGMGLRLLGAVPSVSELQAGRVTRDHFLESYRLIRETLANLGAEGVAPRTILVTSAQAGEGKTSLAVSLAISLAEPGARVLLIDGDVQAPQIGKLLKLPARGDLRSVLSEDHELKEAVVDSGVAGLDVLIGRSNGQSAKDILNSKTAQRLVRLAAEQYDHVVIDSPPALGAADALVWAHAVEGVVLASLVGHSDRRAMRLAHQRLLTVGAKVLGSVIANVSIHESYYSYSTASCPDPGGKSPGGKRRTPPLVHLPTNGQPADERKSRQQG